MRLISLVVPVAIALAAGAPAGAQSSDTGQSGPFHWTDRIPAGATLRILTIRGDIHLSSASGDRADVAGEPRTDARSGGRRIAFKVVHEPGSNDVTICAYLPDGGRCDAHGVHEHNDVDVDIDDNEVDGHGRVPAADFTVQLPKGVNVVLVTGNGRVDATNAGADVSVTSGNGAIRVSQAAGAVRANSGNGEVTVDGAGGRVRAHTGNGRVEVATSTGPVDATSGNGAIDVRMRTLAKPTDMEFSTGNGTITVSLPSNFAGELDATTGHGSVTSDFAMQAVGRITPNHVRADIGAAAAAGGGARLRLSTGNGDLVLRKAD